MFVDNKHGAVMWGFKLQDRSPAVAAKDDAWAFGGMVEGPTEAKNMDSILARIHQFFWEHDPGMYSLRLPPC